MKIGDLKWNLNFYVVLRKNGHKYTKLGCIILCITHFSLY